MRSVRVFLLGLGCAISSFAQAPPPAAPVPRFEDVTKKAGITVSHLSSPDKRYIVESMSGGVGFIDCNNSGKLDIIMVNGSSVDRYKQGGDPMITLYHQDGDLHFSDITQSAGLTHKGWGMAVSVMDYDNDGWQDIFVTGFGSNVLYRNLGNCKFERYRKSRIERCRMQRGCSLGRLRPRRPARCFDSWVRLHIRVLIMSRGGSDRASSCC